jgi:hypothetical protein
LPVNPATVKLALDIFWPAGPGRVSASCHSFLPFANTLVHDIKLSSDVELRLDATPILQGFLNPRRLSMSNGRLDFVGPAVGILWTSLERFCDSSDLVSHQSDIVLRCPNLLSATLHAPSSPLALPELSRTLQELAISLDLVSTDQDIRQFEGLGRYRSLIKLAYNQLSFATNKLGQCRTALSLNPGSVRHLAFHSTQVSNLLVLLRPFIQNRRWLPFLETLVVTIGETDPVTSLVQDVECEDACSQRNIRTKLVHEFSVPRDDEDGVLWATSTWL